MGASSTTGTGTGAADHKGPFNNRDVYLPSNGPRMVLATNLEVEETLTYQFPPLKETSTNYIFQVSALEAGQRAELDGLVITNDIVTGVNIALFDSSSDAAASGSVSFVIIKKGLSHDDFIKS